MKRNQRWNILQIYPRRDSNTGGSDMWYNALPPRPGRRPLLEINVNIQFFENGKNISDGWINLSKICWRDCMLENTWTTSMVLIYWKGETGVAKHNEKCKGSPVTCQVKVLLSVACATDILIIQRHHECIQSLPRNKYLITISPQ